MPDLSGSARRLYRRLIGVPPTVAGARAGEPSAETGLDAVEVAERFISDATESLSEAMGLALTGVRATAFLDGADLARGTAALAQAAGRRVPMVLHVTATALPGAGERAGSGHAALHAAADAGALVLVAANAQEAVDFSLIARQVAEEALLPAVVAMDAAETAMALQDLRMPAPDLVEAILGRANAVRHAPTPSQELLFGQHRARLPRWHDVERPVLNGAVQRADTFALGEAGQAAYFDPHVPAILDQAFERFHKETGRRHAAVSRYLVEDATLVLLAMGSMIEAAELAADHLRHRHKVKVGVIGLRTLRPFPAEALGRAARRRQDGRGPGARLAAVGCGGAAGARAALDGGAGDRERALRQGIPPRRGGSLREGPAPVRLRSRRAGRFSGPHAGSGSPLSSIG